MPGRASCRNLPLGCKKQKTIFRLALERGDFTGSRNLEVQERGAQRRALGQVIFQLPPGVLLILEQAGFAGPPSLGAPGFPPLSRAS